MNTIFVSIFTACFYATFNSFFESVYEFKFILGSLNLLLDEFMTAN